MPRCTELAIEESKAHQHPLLALGDEGLEFVLRLVMASGSLKDLAKSYGVSYPTIRARLDTLIGRLRAIQEGRPADPMAELLAKMIERGEVSTRAARTVLDLHRQINNQNGE